MSTYECECSAFQKRASGKLRCVSKINRAWISEKFSFKDFRSSKWGEIEIAAGLSPALFYVEKSLGTFSAYLLFKQKGYFFFAHKARRRMSFSSGDLEVCDIFDKGVRCLVLEKTTIAHRLFDRPLFPSTTEVKVDSNRGNLILVVSQVYPGKVVREVKRVPTCSGSSGNEAGIEDLGSQSDTVIGFLVASVLALYV